MTDLRSLQADDFPWARKAQHYIARNQKARALRLLDHVIEYDMPLFGDDPTLQEDRRLTLPVFTCTEVKSKFGVYSKVQKSMRRPLYFSMSWTLSSQTERGRI